MVLWSPGMLINAKQAVAVSVLSLSVASLAVAQVDPSFTPPYFENAYVTQGVMAYVEQLDGRVIVAGNVGPINGYLRGGLARINADGSLDTSFDTPVLGPGNGPGGGGAAVFLALQTDGKILVGGDIGTSDSHLVRLNTNGSLDATFNPPPLVKQNARSFVLLASGDILVASSSFPPGGLVRLNPDGSVDSAFTSTVMCGTTCVLGELANGRVMMGGDVRLSASPSDPAVTLVRLAANGARDLTFNPNVVGRVRQMFLRPDGRILVSGLSAIDGVVVPDLSQLNEDGTRDSTFSLTFGTAASWYQLLPDGRILTLLNGVVRMFASSGVLDPSFGVALIAVGGSPAPFFALRDGRLLSSGRINTLSLLGQFIVRYLTGLVLSPDSDGDALPDSWETQFGLNPGSATGSDGGAGDPDGDGRTNVQELVDGTHPRGTFQRYLAEGATSSFFKTRIALLNAGASTAHVQLRYLKGDGTSLGQVLSLLPFRRHTIDVATLPGLAVAEFSTVVEADDTVIVDRTMTWDGTSYGSHAESGVRTPAPTWYLAEGSTAGPFNLFYLIQNPSLTQTSNVRVTFLKPDGSTVVKTYSVGPKTRFNIWVNQVTEVAATDVSGILETTNGVPIIVERAMYLSTPTQVFAAGHESAGITSPAPTWLFAEGATGSFFDEFVLIANPNPTTAQVRATYLLPNGSTFIKDYSVPATSRFNIWVDEESFSGVGKVLANTAVSVTLASQNGVAIIAERSMWWPGPTSATWAEAHNSPGATQTGVRWALAEGEVGALASTDQTDTYVLLANTSPTAGTVRVTLRFEDGTSAEKTFGVAARSRFNVWVKAEFPVSVGKRFGAIVESLGATPAQLVVERAMYSNASGAVWAAGTNALATRLQ